MVGRRLHPPFEAIEHAVSRGHIVPDKVLPDRKEILPGCEGEVIAVGEEIRRGSTGEFYLAGLAFDLGDIERERRLKQYRGNIIQPAGRNGACKNRRAGHAMPRVPRLTASKRRRSC